MKLLVVEDDREIASAIRAGLEDVGFFVEVARDGERALRLALGGSFAAIILDVMLPSLDGMDLCKRLRSRRMTTPILMLTAKGTLADRVEGLNSGADDYLAKPFEFEELIARVRALLRRDKVNKSSRIEVGDLLVDTSARTVTRAGREITLTQREYTLLEALAAAEGQVLTRNAIQYSIWVDEFSSSNTVDVHVRNLRRKIDGGFERKLIHTVYGAGYTLRWEDCTGDCLGDEDDTN